MQIFLLDQNNGEKSYLVPVDFHCKHHGKGCTATATLGLRSIPNNVFG